MRNFSKSTKIFFHISTAFVYGLVLLILGLVPLKAGHGSFYWLELFSEPFGSIGELLDSFNMPLSNLPMFIGCPLFWTLAGIFLSRSEQQLYRKLLTVLMILHYVGAISSIYLIPEEKNLTTFSTVFSSFLTGAPIAMIVYLLGHIVVWVRLRKARNVVINLTTEA